MGTTAYSSPSASGLVEARIMTDSSNVRVTLLVLYCERLEECRLFYGDLGLDFTAEKHGQGPSHYAARPRPASTHRP
jgi:hypothetical protein